MAEKVIKTADHYEVEPWRMKEFIQQQEMNGEAISKIVKDRMNYLTWMHRQEAYQCLQGYTEAELSK